MQKCAVFLGVTAPRDLLLEGHVAEPFIGRDLVARQKDRFALAVPDLDFALEDRDAGSLEAVIDGEDCPFDRHLAVVGVDEEPSTVLVGRVDDDIAVAEIDRGAAPGRSELELGTLVHFHDRTVGETNQCAGTVGGAHHLAGADLVACRKRLAGRALR